MVFYRVVWRVLIGGRRNAPAGLPLPTPDPPRRRAQPSGSTPALPAPLPYRSLTAPCFRGKCEITFVKDIRSLGDCDLSRENRFFSCLSYNQESSRLASVQGEIRVGASYQVGAVLFCLFLSFVSHLEVCGCFLSVLLLVLLDFRRKLAGPVLFLSSFVKCNLFFLCCYVREIVLKTQTSSDSAASAEQRLLID